MYLYILKHILKYMFNREIDQSHSGVSGQFWKVPVVSVGMFLCFTGCTRSIFWHFGNKNLKRVGVNRFVSRALGYCVVVVLSL